MSSVIEQYLKKGEEIGLKIGEERGKKKGIELGAERKEAEVNERVATDMLRDGKPLMEILKYSKLPENHIRRIAQRLGVTVL